MAQGDDGVTGTAHGISFLTMLFSLHRYYICWALGDRHSLVKKEPANSKLSMPLIYSNSTLPGFPDQRHTS